ncbi:GAF domain-containing protein [Mycolicibacterium sp. 018/SC-01/001]|uniref:GAF domain-containing protein n=1 Tax=Mycolicibacterium sp. 018/SC-01/001 TaxID=2592069 RepID=UPI00117D26B8|nr:GAF domain-containing protein [Mycolicibacterium sp. 018/SC-01/001]TRW86316.1 GAF domain-containing protein [Mycolicibacterium sp. 018/SC-01/001]
MTSVYRAPMRSRRDDVDPQLARDRAFALGLVGFGRIDVPQRRVDRFAAVPDGSFVWTRDEDGLFWLGRLDGPYVYDAAGEDVDLVHVRPCRWLPRPVVESRCPAAVLATYARGGRNFQQIHDARVGAESLRVWTSQ